MFKDTLNNCNCFRPQLGKGYRMKLQKRHSNDLVEMLNQNISLKYLVFSIECLV